MFYCFCCKPALKAPLPFKYSLLTDGQHTHWLTTLQGGILPLSSHTHSYSLSLWWHYTHLHFYFSNISPPLSAWKRLRRGTNDLFVNQKMPKPSVITAALFKHPDLELKWSKWFQTFQQTVFKFLQMSDFIFSRSDSVPCCVLVVPYNQILIIH